MEQSTRWMIFVMASALLVTATAARASDPVRPALEDAPPLPDRASISCGDRYYKSLDGRQFNPPMVLPLTFAMGPAPLDVRVTVIEVATPSTLPFGVRRQALVPRGDGIHIVASLAGQSATFDGNGAADVDVPSAPASSVLRLDGSIEWAPQGFLLEFVCSD
jgi:hypothetical protein